MPEIRSAAYSLRMTAGSSPAFEPPLKKGISLHELSEAFAQTVNRRPPARTAEPEIQQSAQDLSGPAGQPADASGQGPQPPVAPTGFLTEADGGGTCPISPLSVLEALLFLGNREGRPLSAADAVGLMRGVEPGEIPNLVDQLNRRYAARGCPYWIVHQGPGYRMAIRREFYWLRDRFFGRIRQARLSQAAVDVLAIVAYRQPVTAEQVTKLRGTPSGPILAQLVRRRLLRIERPAQSPRNPVYYTTERFLEVFGIESLADLPRPDDLDHQ
ncbi:MAG: SMC-Scp complex subunit ScpB [Thermoguttaceae bacterium]